VKIAQKAGKSWKRTRKFGQFLVGVAIVTSLQLAFHIYGFVQQLGVDHTYIAMEQ